ncbi:MAG: MFS transporter [Verrucomicrobia bacterium]|nr:MFS transporter [Verrucomicrobiota bacterium]
MGCNGMLALLFLTGFVSPEAAWSVGGQDIPAGLSLFVAFHAGYWLGMGILLPNATAMMADAAEINYLQTGIKKDGGYSSVFSVASRLAFAIGLIASGYGLRFIGYRALPGSDVVVQTPLAIWRLGMLTFAGGGLMCLLALLTIWKYPVTRDQLEAMRAETV